MIKVIVNDVSLDLKSGAVIALSKKSADIGTLQNRFSSFTNKFQVKNTKKNRDALGIKQYQDTSFGIDQQIGGAQYRELTGKLVLNGIEIASNVAVIIESVAEDITLTIRAGNGNLFDRLNRTKMSDIDFDFYNHYWNSSEILAAISNDWQSVYVYPLCNTGNQSLVTKTAQAKGLIPFVFVKGIYALIAEMFGYNWTGSTYTLQAFEYLMMPISRLSISQGFADTFKIEADLDTVTYVSVGGGNDLDQPIGLTSTLDTWGFQQVVNNGIQNVDAYQIPVPGKYVIDVFYDIDVNHVGSLGVSVLDIVSTVEGANATIDLTPAAPDVPQNFTGTLTLELTYDEILDNLPIGSSGIGYVYTSFLSTAPAGSTFTINSGGTFKIREISAEKTHYNRPVSLGDHLPDWTLGKFIKEVGNVFGAIYDVDEFRKEIEITRLDEIAANRDQAYDWTDKLDLSFKPEVAYTIDGVGRTSIWQWNDELRYFHEVSVINAQLPERLSYVKSEAAHSNSEYVCQQSIPVVSFPVWDEENLRVNMDGKARFAFYRVDNEEFYIADFKLLPQQQDLHPAAYFDYDESPYSLDWSRLYSSYYQQLFEPMTWYMNKVVAYFKLTDLDIQQFRFKYPVYIKHFNRYFYVNEISEFTGKDQSTKCTLIAI